MYRGTKSPSLNSNGSRSSPSRGDHGRPPKLRPKQIKRLIQLLLQGSMARGYRTNLWTTVRIAQLIEEEFGVHYHPNHIGRLMHRLQWSHQKPERRALERNDAAIEQWKRQHGLALKKSRSVGRPSSVCRRRPPLFCRWRRTAILRSATWMMPRGSLRNMRHQASDSGATQGVFN